MIDGRDGCISGAFRHLTVLTVAIQDGTVENGRREVSAWQISPRLLLRDDAKVAGQGIRELKNRKKRYI
jgi:hypothetical protein